MVPAVPRGMGAVPEQGVGGGSTSSGCVGLGQYQHGGWVGAVPAWGVWAWGSTSMGGGWGQYQHWGWVGAVAVQGVGLGQCQHGGGWGKGKRGEEGPPDRREFSPD